MNETPSNRVAASTDASSARPDYVSYLGLAFMAMAFGSTFLFQRIALDGMSALEAGSFRIIFGAAFLLPATFIARQPLPKTARLWSWAAFNGLVGIFIPFNMAMWALLYVPTSIAATIYSVIPLIVLALSRLFLGVYISKRKWLGVYISKRKWIGLLLGAVGLMVLTLLGDSSAQLIQGDLLPKFVILVSAVLIAISGIAIRQMPKSPPISAMAAAVSIAALASIVALSILGLSEVISAKALVAIAAAGLISTAMGQTVRFFLLRRRGPVFIAPNAYLAAFVATVLGVLFLAEPVTYALVIGFGVILLGLVIAQHGTGNMTSV